MDSVLSNLFSSIGERITNYRNVNENMEMLKRKCEDLNCRREDVESRVKTELRPRKKLKKEVDKWLANVQEMNSQKQTIEIEVSKGNYLDRSSLGKLIVEKLQEVEELYRNGIFSDGVVLDAPSGKGIVFPSTTLVGETTAKRKMEEVWEHLMSNESPYIGLYGMGGSGKTTIMKHIHNRVLNESDKFDKVIWITVSKATNVIRFQNDIATALNLDISKHEDEATRAKWLYHTLKEEKRLLLILDDMWDTFDLQEVGIPEPAAENGCKLIITTRSQEVCRRMNCKCIKMELLSDDEAWDFFLHNVGRDVILTPNLEAIAKDVAKECACLPLAIITIGKSMNSVVDQSEWRNVLRELSMSRKGFNEMKKVIERVKISYTRLKDEKLQQCLLYCALYPEDFKIKRDDVIAYLIADEIVEGNASWQAKCDEGNTILNNLESACLLESFTDEWDRKVVKMHDVIRDMALQIMGPGSMVKAREGLRDFPDTEEWKEDLEKVSLMDNDVEEINPEASPKCPRLKTLLLARNRGLTGIPDSFFSNMSCLRILDISDTEIQCLPDSISGMEHLRELRLENCEKLTHVPSLAKLQGLRLLNLLYTAIAELPQGLEMLVNLQYLDLFGCEELTCQTGILSKLIRLQYLTVSLTSENPNIAEEIANLSKLETLMVNFYYSNDFETYVGSLQLQQRGFPNSFFLMVGPLTERMCMIYRIEEHSLQPRNFIGMSFEETDMVYDPKVRLLPNHDVDELYIGENVKLSSLCDLLIIGGGGGGLPSSALQSMSTFFCLRKLNIGGNDHIKKVFTPQLMPLFQNLEEICVWYCGYVREIFSATEGDEEEEEEINDHPMITLPKLRFLTLWDLPELKSITSSSSSSSRTRRGIMMVCNSIQEIKVFKCPNLKRLPLSLPVHFHDDGRPSPPPSLTKIEIDNREWWDSLEWDNPLDKDMLQPFL